MRVVLTLFALVLTTVFLMPQARAQPPGPKLTMETLRAEGTIKGVRPRLLHVAVGDDEDWLVSVPNEYQQFLYEATATPKWLRMPMPVRFSALVVIEKRMREIVIKEPVSELTVTPLRPEFGVGLFPDRSNNQGPSVFDRQARKEEKKRPRREPVEVPCVIIGRLAESKDGKLRVVAGNRSVRFELAPEAEISVEWHDVQWVQPGDKIDLTARYPAGRRGQAQGQQITITAAKVLDLKEKATRGRSKSGREQESDDSEKKIEADKADDERKKID